MQNSVAQTVLLINPPVYDFAAYDLYNKPLGLLYLADLLRRCGYNVRMIDCLDRNHRSLEQIKSKPATKANGTGKYLSSKIEKPACIKHVRRIYRRYGLPEDIFAELLAREYEQYQPAAVLVTSMMTYWSQAVADTIELVRRCVPDTPIGLGGVYATLMSEHAQRNCKCDRVFAGSDPTALLSWLDDLAGREKSTESFVDDFQNNPGLAYEFYDKLDYLTFVTSLGCPYFCSYCASRLLQPKLRQIEPDVFMEHLLRYLPLLGDRDIYHIAFMDDALLANAQGHIIPILEKIIALKKPIKLHCPNGLHVRFITPEVARLMKLSGFSMVRLSYEATAEQSFARQASDNKLTDEHFVNAVKNLADAGFDRSELDAYILTGLPGQSLDEAYESARAVNRLGVKVRICQYTPIPGTPLFETSCNDFGIDPDEPLLHNNSIIPILTQNSQYDDFQKFKSAIGRLNESL